MSFTLLLKRNPAQLSRVTCLNLQLIIVNSSFTLIQTHQSGEVSFAKIIVFPLILTLQHPYHAGLKEILYFLLFCIRQASKFESKS